MRRAAMCNTMNACKSSRADTTVVPTVPSTSPIMELEQAWDMQCRRLRKLRRSASACGADVATVSRHATDTDRLLTRTGFLRLKACASAAAGNAASGGAGDADDASVVAYEAAPGAGGRSHKDASSITKHGTFALAESCVTAAWQPVLQSSAQSKACGRAIAWCQPFPGAKHSRAYCPGERKCAELVPSGTKHGDNEDGLPAWRAQPEDVPPPPPLMLAAEAKVGRKHSKDTPVQQKTKTGRRGPRQNTPRAMPMLYVKRFHACTHLLVHCVGGTGEEAERCVQGAVPGCTGRPVCLGEYPKHGVTKGPREAAIGDVWVVRASSDELQESMGLGGLGVAAGHWGTAAHAAVKRWALKHHGAGAKVWCILVPIPPDTAHEVVSAAAYSLTRGTDAPPTPCLHFSGVHTLARGSPDGLWRCRLTCLVEGTATVAAADMRQQLTLPAVEVSQAAAAAESAALLMGTPATRPPLAFTLYRPDTMRVPGPCASWVAWGATVWIAMLRLRERRVGATWQPDPVPWPRITCAAHIVKSCFPEDYQSTVLSVCIPLASYVQLAAATWCSMLWYGANAEVPHRLVCALMSISNTRSCSRASRDVTDHALRLFYWASLHSDDVGRSQALRVRNDTGEHAPPCAATASEMVTRAALEHYARHGWVVTVCRMYGERGAKRARAAALELVDK